jgi:hypothetical protein
MFYMLANVHYQIITAEVLPLPDRFWYYLLDIPYGIQNALVSFQLDGWAARWGQTVWHNRGNSTKGAVRKRRGH